MEEPIGKLLEHGFAIAVATFLLLRMDKRIEELRDSVMHLAGVIEKQGGRR